MTGQGASSAYQGSVAMDLPEGGGFPGSLPPPSRYNGHASLTSAVVLAYEARDRDTLERVTRQAEREIADLRSRAAH